MFSNRLDVNRSTLYHRFTAVIATIYSQKACVMGILHVQNQKLAYKHQGYDYHGNVGLFVISLNCSIFKEE